jgi:hypothetical protein
MQPLLFGGNPVAGTFVYTPSATTVLNAGTVKSYL